MSAHFKATSGPLAGTTLELNKGTKWTLGRDPDLCDLTLEDSTVSREHARIRKTKEGFFLTNLSAVNPILINDQPIDEESLLKEGDLVKIGQSVFVFSVEQQARPQDLYNSIFEDEEELEEQEPDSDSFEGENSPYATIFDDHETEEEQLPLHFVGPTPLLLKVILGPNTGAEFGLERNRSYLLGKDPLSCDVLFQDLSVSKNHARLHVDADGNVQIEDLNSKNGTLVNNVAIKEPVQISSHDLVTLGTTSFVVIDRGQSLETVYSMPEISSDHITQQAQEIAKDEPIAAKKPVNWREQIIPIHFLVMAGAFVVLVLGVSLSFFSLFKGESVKIAKTDFHKEIEEHLKEYPSVTFSYNAGANKLFLAGHLLTTTDERRLLYTLSALHFIHDVENMIVIDEQVWKNMNDLLSMFPEWKGIRIFSPKAGEFIVAGYLNTPEEATNLADFLSMNFPYTDLLKNQVAVEQLLDAQIQNLLLTRGFEGLSFQMSAGELILAGMYPQTQKVSFEKLLEDLRKIRGVSEIKNLSSAASEESARIDLSDKYAVTGTTRQGGKEFNAVINGRIVSVGDLLDGMHVTGLQSNMVLLERNGIRYKIVVNR